MYNSGIIEYWIVSIYRYIELYRFQYVKLINLVRYLARVLDNVYSNLKFVYITCPIDDLTQSFGYNTIVSTLKQIYETHSGIKFVCVVR